MNPTESISFDFDLPHPPEKVWRALTDPDLLAQWLLPSAGFGLAQERRSPSRRLRNPAGMARCIASSSR